MQAGAARQSGGPTNPCLDDCFEGDEEGSVRFDQAGIEIAGDFFGMFAQSLETARRMQATCRLLTVGALSSWVIRFPPSPALSGGDI